MLNGILGKHQRIAAQDVVDVRALLRQHIDMGDVGRRAGEIGVDFGTADHQDTGDAESAEVLGNIKQLLNTDNTHA